MPTDYRDAATRHFDDAAMLAEHGRQANAGQLWGQSAECFLKAVLRGAGVAGGHKPHNIHIESLWPAFGFSCAGRTPGRYCSHFDASRPFHDWKIDHRYDSEAYIPLGSLAEWQRGAEEARRLHEGCILDGLLS